MSRSQSTPRARRGLAAAAGMIAGALLAASPVLAAGITGASFERRTTNESLLCWDNPFVGQPGADTFRIRQVTGFSRDSTLPAELTGGDLVDPARRLGDPLRDARLCAIVVGGSASGYVMAVETAGTNGRPVLTSTPVGEPSAIPINDINRPSIASVSPTNGSADGGTEVTIQGTFGHAFDAPARGAVYFSNSATPAEIVSASPTTLVVKAPPAQVPGTAQVVVFGFNGVSGGIDGSIDAPVPTFTYTPKVGIKNAVLQVVRSHAMLFCWDNPYAGDVEHDDFLLHQLTPTDRYIPSSWGLGSVYTSARLCKVYDIERTSDATFQIETNGIPYPRIYSQVFADRGHIPIGDILKPVMTSVSPASGPVAGGTTVTLRGTFGTIFDPTEPESVGKVYFSGSTAPAEIISRSRTELVVKAPPGEREGAEKILVFGANGVSDPTDAATFTYTAAGPLPGSYDVTGQAILKTLTRGTLPLTGTATGTLAAGAVSLDLALAPTNGTLVALGFLPVKAAVAFAPVGPATGTLDGAGLTLNAKERIKLTSVTLFGLQLVSGGSCQTRTPTNIALKGPGFDPSTGGALTGTFAIGDLTGCGALNGLVSPLTAGTGNAIALRLTKVG